jgi:hypothetical protein
MMTYTLRVLSGVTFVGAGYYAGTHDPNMSTVLSFIVLVAVGHFLMVTSIDIVEYR